MASVMIAQPCMASMRFAHTPAAQKRGIAHTTSCLVQQPGQKKRQRRSGGSVRFNCTLMIGSCTADYDRTPIANCSRISKEEMMILYRQKLENIPLLNWSNAERVRFFERMAAKQALAVEVIQPAMQLDTGIQKSSDSEFLEKRPDDNTSAEIIPESKVLKGTSPSALVSALNATFLAR